MSTATASPATREMAPRRLSGVWSPSADVGTRPDHRPRTGRDWVVDSICFGLALGFVVFFSEATWEAARLPSWLFFPDLVAGLAASVALWWRRRWPVALAIGMLPIEPFSAAMGGAAAILIFTVAVHRRPAVALSVGGLYALTIPLHLIMYPDPEIDFWVTVAWVTSFHIAVVGWGMYVRARRQLVASLQERALQAESDQGHRLERARYLERERIAREMHDILGHRLSLLSLHAGALELRGDASPEEVARAAAVIRDSAHQALEDLRGVISVLRDESTPSDAVRPQPDLGDLSALVAESTEAGMRVNLDNRIGPSTAVPAGIGRNAYRIAQEGLTNARKHAPGSVVAVSVDGIPGDGLRVEVRNPLPVGMGPSEIPGAGAGLVGLAERAALVGGRLEHGRTSGGDFRLWAWLPWPG